jgi:hypothetical protein
VSRVVSSSENFGGSEAIGRVRGKRVGGELMTQDTGLLLAASLAAIVLGLGPVLLHGAEPAAGSDEAALETLRAEIVTAIGEPRCANLVHCRALALGARPCGGPSEYLAYSSITGNRELLEAKAYEYGFLQEEVNRKQSAAGTCAVLPQPRAACIDGRCSLR